MTYPSVVTSSEYLKVIYEATVRSQFRRSPGFDLFYSILLEGLVHLDEVLNDAKYNVRLSTANLDNLKHYARIFNLRHTDMEKEDLRRCIQACLFCKDFDGSRFSNYGIISQVRLLTGGVIEYANMPPKGFDVYSYVDLIPSESLIANYKDICNNYRSLGSSLNITLVYRPNPNISERTQNIGNVDGLTSWKLL